MKKVYEAPVVEIVSTIAKEDILAESDVLIGIGGLYSDLFED